jgi:hypothetical protein
LAKIFICYRRDDSGPAAGRIYDRLERHFGRGQVFIDVDDVPPGVDYRDYLNRQIGDCDLVLAVMGPKWLTARDGRRGRRLDAPRDFVRTEIEIALKRGIPLIPILLEGVTMPRDDQLPISIQPLAFRNAATVHAAGGQFRGHMDRLIRGIEGLLDHAETELRAQPHTAPEPRSPDAAQRNPGKPWTSRPKTPPPAPPNPTPRSPERAQRSPGPAQPAKSEPPPKPEAQALLAEIADPATSSERRLAIGDRLAELGDPRPGVGLTDGGLPDIDWVEIPPGYFLYGERKEPYRTEGFRIARYPITNAQYQAFVAAGGYGEARWWQGLAQRIEGPDDPGWPQPNRPRETVTWYEAMAYCAWLGDRLGLAVRLPTEVEWERAARGTDGREYPWGDGYRAGHANIDEQEDRTGPSYLKQTTAVGLYPQGASPEGVLDLAGNVWEWCINAPEDPKQIQSRSTGPRVLRGGSWRSGLHLARARNVLLPDRRRAHCGFRVLCGPPIH